MASNGGEAVRFQSLKNAGLLDMGNDRLYKIECLHMLGTSESERLKVTVLTFSTRPPLPFSKS